MAKARRKYGKAEKQSQGRVSKPAKGINEPKNTGNVVNEPALSYGSAKVHGYMWSEIIQTPILSEFDYLAISQKGLTKNNIDELATALGISRKTMAEDVFDISVKTMERKGPKDKLDKKISSHAVEIAKLWQHACIVFGEEQRARLWFNRPNQSLNQLKPVVLLDTLTGLNMIGDILTRIEEGVYS